MAGLAWLADHTIAKGGQKLRDTLPEVKQVQNKMGNNTSWIYPLPVTVITRIFISILVANPYNNNNPSLATVTGSGVDTK